MVLDTTQYRAGTFPAGCDLLFDNRCLPGQLRKVLGCLGTVRWVCVLHMAVRGDCFIRPVTCLTATQLVNILTEVNLMP